MKIIQLSNPSNFSVKAQFMTASGGLDISKFPKMTPVVIAPNYPFIDLVICNYFNIKGKLYRKICAIDGEKEFTLYVTTEPGQIIEHLHDNKLDFINLTQIQAVGLEVGVKI